MNPSAENGKVVLVSTVQRLPMRIEVHKSSVITDLIVTTSLGDLTPVEYTALWAPGRVRQ